METHILLSMFNHTVSELQNLFPNIEFISNISLYIEDSSSSY